MELTTERDIGRDARVLVLVNWLVKRLGCDLRAVVLLSLHELELLYRASRNGNDRGIVEHAVKAAAQRLEDQETRNVTRRAQYEADRSRRMQLKGRTMGRMGRWGR